VGLLLRTWNLFHGNTVPPQRRAFLQEMVRRVTADGPDVVLLQEVPVWALRRLERWSGMQAFPAVARGPRVGSAELGRWITALNHGLIRSAVTGQANAILARQGEPRGVLELTRTPERRVAQAMQLVDGPVVVNLHASQDGRAADDETLRAAAWAESLTDGPIVLAGDFNLRLATARSFQELAERGIRHVGGSVVDHVLVRDLAVGPVERWPDERRTLDGRLLSDHAPLEVTIE
jgi:endonuclease/exonuclease/phosphatase family metal-dependent hydrolase